VKSEVFLKEVFIFEVFSALFVFTGVERFVVIQPECRIDRCVASGKKKSTFSRK
jgi:hypothetical protein